MSDLTIVSLPPNFSVRVRSGEVQIVWTRPGKRLKVLARETVGRLFDSKERMRVSLRSTPRRIGVYVNGKRIVQAERPKEAR